MADPLTIGAGLAIGGSALGGVSGFLQGRTAAEDAETQGAFQQQLASENAAFAKKLGKHNASQILAISRAEETRLRRFNRRRIGQTKAEFGASGATITGSALEVLADQAMEAEEEALLIRFGGKLEAQQARFQGKLQARDSLLGGQVAGFEARRSASAARSRGFGSLLGATGDIGGTLLTPGAIKV